MADTTTAYSLMVADLGYTAWMYRQRASESPMPTYLRYALNNRIVSASTAAPEGTA